VAAVAALHDAEKRLASLNGHAAARGEPELAHGVGLHFGTASYGNIGGSERLDFTVIGRAVNIASRIESECKPIGASALCSREFSELAGISSRALGQFNLKGVAGQIELHAFA
jgi:adenylate cyclase